ncbi:AbrB/MazE/SpoVT family DNA-binding domain-containing protein [Acerihabitans sp. KWT182]|uniref:AbrB/MazE/SpoVT family DNA-binding domain-containing protein n=1 Tax=Acerihabitans sp. KWT182 TaxID=3157919 RepID=A0AAU7Q7J1_9GAMM
MSTAISKWGNGVGLRIPQPFLWQLGLEVGDRVEFKIVNDKIIISKSGPTLEELLGRCTAENRHDELFGDSQGKEML